MYVWDESFTTVQQVSLILLFILMPYQFLPRWHAGYLAPSFIVCTPMEVTLPLDNKCYVQYVIQLRIQHILKLMTWQWKSRLSEL